MPISSSASLVTFKTRAHQALEGLRTQGADMKSDLTDIRNGINTVYGVYASTLPFGVPAKVALIDQRLRTDMEAIFTSIGNRLAVLQDGNWPRLCSANLITEYQKNTAIALSDDADTACKKYIHVYPAGTTFGWGGQVTLPQARTAVTGTPWRIGINAEPGSMAAALAKILPIMDGNDCIQHIKFTAPGLAAKPDAIILYMTKNDGTYDNLRTAVGVAMTDVNITLQGCFNLLWNEFADGLGEAAEPPNGGYSFGMYRSVLAFMAYFDLLQNDMSYDDDLFSLWINDIFVDFRIDVNHPHLQSSIIDVSYMTPKLALYSQLMALAIDGDIRYANNYTLPTI